MLRHQEVKVETEKKGYEVKYFALTSEPISATKTRKESV